MTLEKKIKSSIRDVSDFPVPGIVFKDITPILKDSKLCSEILEGFIKNLLLFSENVSQLGFLAWRE